MHGEFFFAWSKRSRTREAPTPTNISTNSEPEILKKGTPASPATALESRVLPVPGGPTISTPLGMRAPSAAATERDRLVVAALGLAEHVPHEAADHQEEDDVRQDDGEEQVRRAGRLGVEVDLVIAQDLLDLEGVAEDRLVVVALVIPRDLVVGLLV